MTRRAPPDGLIIDVPHQMSTFRRSGDALLTVLATVVWVFAFRPLLLIGLWYVGFRVAHLHMIELQGIRNPRFFSLLGLMALGVLLVQLLWSRYNAFRFRELDRRQSKGTASDVAMAAHYAVETEVLERLRGCQAFRMTRLERDRVEIVCSDDSRVVVRHDPLGVNPGSPKSEPSAGPS